MGIIYTAIDTMVLINRVSYFPKMYSINNLYEIRKNNIMYMCWSLNFVLLKKFNYTVISLAPGPVQGCSPNL